MADLSDVITALEALVSLLKGISKLKGLFTKKGKSKPSKDIDTINTE